MAELLLKILLRLILSTCMYCRNAFEITINLLQRGFSPVVRKTAFCIWENKDADQLGSNCAADQRLCFRYIDSTIPPFPIV